VPAASGLVDTEVPQVAAPAPAAAAEISGNGLDDLAGAFGMKYIDFSN